MIEMYTGKVGSGKSYHVVKRGLNHIYSRNKKRYVVANFPITYKKIADDRWIFLEDLTVSKLVEISLEKGFVGKEGHGLLLIDEAGVVFNARDWNISPNERKAWIKFFSQSRKFGYDVVFILQDDNMLDRQIRKLCEYEVKHLKLNNYKLLKYVPWTFFLYVRFWYGMKFKGSIDIDIYLPGVAKRYDTMKIFSFDEEIMTMLTEYGYTGEVPVPGAGEGMGSLPVDGKGTGKVILFWKGVVNYVFDCCKKISIF